MQFHRHGTSRRIKVDALSAALALILAGSATADNGPASRPGAMQDRPAPPSLAQQTQDYRRFRAVFAELVALPAPVVRAPTTRRILSLADEGSGSLRDALAAAADGDVIDLQGLSGRITLSRSLTTAAAVTIKGPGRNVLTLDGAGKDRVITSTGALTLSGITLANGRVLGGNAAGGCLISATDLTLADATFNDCHTGDSSTATAYGGAIAASLNATLTNCTISNSSATANQLAIGGGIVAGKNLLLLGSTVSGNHADQVLAPTGTPPADSPFFAVFGGGGVSLAEDATVYLMGSKVTGNTISASGGNYSHDVDGAPVTEYAYGNAYGGGIASRYAAILHSVLTANTAQANGLAYGGGWYLKASPTPQPRPIGSRPALPSPTWAGLGMTGVNTASSAQDCEISNNNVSTTNGDAFGGGIHARHPLSILGCAVTGNTAISEVSSGYHSGSGGIFGGAGSLEVIASTISGNTGQAQVGNGKAWGGGIGMTYGTPLTLTDSTVSGNQILTNYSSSGGGIAASVVQFDNSTIAFNSAPSDGGGVVLYGSGAGTKLIRSTIIANNTVIADPSAADLHTYNSSAAVDGDHNIVIASNSVSWTTPPMTSNPLLLALAFNGGPTKTHALGAGSPAINAGSNPVPIDTDQRGYPRTVGANPDIGALEVDNDRIFTNGFDAQLGGP